MGIPGRVLLRDLTQSKLGAAIEAARWRESVRRMLFGLRCVTPPALLLDAEAASADGGCAAAAAAEAKLEEEADDDAWAPSLLRPKDVDTMRRVQSELSSDEYGGAIVTASHNVWGFRMEISILCADAWRTIGYAHDPTYVDRRRPACS